jgi:peptide deformylase
VGLAAPQVGVNVRLMVYNPVGERGSGEEYVLVNPRIVKYGKTRDVFDEGCLSFPVIERGSNQAPTIEAAVEVSSILPPSLPSSQCVPEL